MDQGRVLPDGRQRDRVHRANERFRGGEGLFIFNGDWESANLDKEMAGNVGFFLFPPRTRAAPVAAMSAPLTYGIGGQGEERRLRRLLPQLGRDGRAGPQDRRRGRRLEPGGPGRLAIPPVAAGIGHERDLAAGAKVAEDNGAMDFIANATGSIFAQGWTPELQKMVGGKQDAAGLLSAVQAEYKRELEQGS